MMVPLAVPDAGASLDGIPLYDPTTDLTFPVSRKRIYSAARISRTPADPASITDRSTLPQSLSDVLPNMTAMNPQLAAVASKTATRIASLPLLAARYPTLMQPGPPTLYSIILEKSIL